MTLIIIALIVAVTIFMSVAIMAFVMLKLHKDFKEEQRASRMDFNRKRVQSQIVTDSKRETFKDVYKK